MGGRSHSCHNLVRQWKEPMLEVCEPSKSQCQNSVRPGKVQEPKKCHCRVSVPGAETGQRRVRRAESVTKLRTPSTYKKNGEKMEMFKICFAVRYQPISRVSELDLYLKLQRL